jgi:radical SAM superfamily enzyme YgiQ (UPF0313 family)
LKVLFIYPRYPDTFWSFRHALRIAGKKASYPPLGLLTVAAMLPHDWEKKLVDMNVRPLKDEHISWADYVFISAMVVQRSSVREVIDRCKKFGTKIVAGGPLFTQGHEEFMDVDHLVLDEAEVTLPPFLDDLDRGCAKHIYTSKERPDVTKTPIPLWSLLDLKKYSSTNIQYSRGCPYNCDFCDIIILNGNVPRTKSKEQILAELDALYNRGWRDGIFIVDDNFIGNKKKLKTEILPAIIEWQKARKYPSMLLTETSINLSDDEELMRLMAKAGFDTVFIGIESPNEESLAECSKQQNRGRDLVASIKKIQNHGLQVQGGFILGFDNDPVSIFKSQINFIQRSGIVTAMVGLLNAPPGTKLYQRLKKENRLLEGTITGDNTDGSMNFIPKMEPETLINGYQSILATIYSSKEYYKRIKVFFKEYKPVRRKRVSHLQLWHVRTFLRSMWVLGIRDRERLYYWRFIISTLLKRPQHFPLSIALAVYGYHFRQVVRKYVGTGAWQVPT